MKLDTSKIKGIIFDYGGTLDTGGDHWSEVIWNAYQKAGVMVDKAEFREAYVYAERELARTLHILPHHNFGDLLQIKMNIELQCLAEKNLFPAADVDSKSKEIAGYCYDFAKSKVASAKGVLETLSKSYKMVLVSNFYGNISTVLADFGVKEYFSKIIESAVVGVRKPDPEIFRLGARAMDLAPEETLVIGDSYSKDILPAEKIGCQTLWLKGKGWTAEEDATFHENIISSLDSVLELLDGQ